MTTRVGELVERVLAGLADAPRDRRSPWRLLQLATVAPDGFPELRTLVLRGFGRAPLGATFHADRRSPKFRALAADARVALLNWSDDTQIQVRLRGTAGIHAGDAVARAEWDGLSPGARATYALRTPPGDPVGDGEAEQRIPDADAYEQYAVIRVAITAIDILKLGPDGAQFRVAATPDDAGGVSAWRIGA